MKQILMGPGGIRVAEVPAPAVDRGCLLVQVERSCISVGTEMSGVRASNMTLLERAMKRPDQVKKTLDLVREHGVGTTRTLVKNQLEAQRPLGYSAAGIVVEIGDDVHGFEIGDRVACAGGQAAFHAEIITVPKNLCVAVPEQVTSNHAATVTLGAIALQGVRRAQPTLGETAVVIGLGLLGQLTVQILRANGCKVIGADLDETRIARARANGMDGTLPTSDASDQISLADKAARLTDGVGADFVIITAASPDETLLSTAFEMCRRKGRVVLVGDVPIQINRDAIYAKELDFFISTSYGPGRYDKSFEEEGLSYPIGYVRWTETRNMAAYLDLIAARRIKVDDLIGAEFGLDDAGKAYAALNSADRPLSVILSYPETPADVLRSRTRFYERTQPDRASPKSTDAHDRTGGPGVRSSGRISLGVIGPGGFFKSTLLPILEKEASRFTISAIATRQGHSAHSLAERTKAALATTDPSDLVQHQDVNAVMIATRHDTHARLVLESLRSGKHVFVEKPLCLSSDELSQIADFFESGEATGTPPVLLTGFNRRFSRTAQELKKAVSRRTQPMIMNYRVNAGFVPPESWVHGSEGGGRNIGEACHFYDMFTFLADAEVTSVTARAISPQSPHYRRDDNFVASITFSDGSIATLTYSALGNPAFPKEQLEVHCDGQIFTLDDYRRLTQAGRSKPLVEHRTSSKGHDAELVAFAQAVTSGDGSPIPLWQQFQAMQIAFRVQEEIS